jgi:hypothetical protein
MIGPTSTDLIKHILANPKDAKTIAKIMLEAPMASKTTNGAPLAQTLLNALSKGETTQAQVRQTLESTPWVKNAPLLTKDIKNLITALKQDPNLKSFAQPLERVLSNSTPNNQNTASLLQTKLENSGIHYEATIKQSIPTTTISTQGRSLIDTLLQLLPKAPLAPSLKAPLQAIAKDFLQSPSPQKAEQFLQNLSSTLEHAQSHLAKSHPLLPLSKSVEQLAQILSSTKSPLPTKPSTIQPNQAPQPQQANQHLSIQQHAKALLVRLEAATPALKATNIGAQTIQSIKSTLQQIANTPSSPPSQPQYNTQNIPLHVNQPKPNTLQPQITPNAQSSAQPQNISNLPNLKQFSPNPAQNINPLAPQPKQAQNAIQAKTSTFNPQQAQQITPIFAILSQLQPQTVEGSSGDLQTKLNQAILRIQTIIQQSDALASKLPTAFSKLENLQAQIKSNLSSLTTPPQNPQESTINDVKRLLLEVQQSTSGKETPLAREVNNLAAKALGQLDFHQLYSLVSQQTHTYLPYLWDGLQGGALQFKRDEERSYCKIDLEFEKYNKVQILIGLFGEHYITLTVGIEHPELFNKISSHLKTLRSMLSEVGLVPQNVTLLPTLQEMPYENFAQEGSFGFDFKV